MNNSPINHRYDGIQALRFLAALLVVITHATFYATERLGGGEFVWNNGGRGVDIFFIISGVVMVISSRRLIENKDGWKLFVTKRLQRIVPLYWGATTFKVVTVLLMSGLVLHANLDWWNIFKSYLFIPSKNIDGEIVPFLGVGWTLVFEMFFYLVFAAALFFRKNIYTFVGAVLLVFSAASLFRGETYSPWWFLMDSVILEFYMGMVLGYFTLKRRFWPSQLSVVACLLALAYSLLSADLLQLPRFIEAGIPAAIIVWSTISLEKHLHGRIPGAVMFFGSASYALYLFHPLIAPLAPTILKKLSIVNFPLSVLCSLAIAMVAAAAIHQWIEKPFNNIILNYSPKPSEKIQSS